MYCSILFLQWVYLISAMVNVLKDSIHEYVCVCLAEFMCVSAEEAQVRLELENKRRESSKATGA